MNKQVNTVNLEEIKQKLYEKLKPSGWADKLKTFILSSDFDKILKALLKDAQEGKRFTPQLKQVFRAFEECPYNELKVILMGQDPYPHLGIADGIAFSCSNTKNVEASLKYMFKELESTVYPNGYTWDPDLKRWSNQGILMLNSALTTTISKVGQHYSIWQPFIAFLMDQLMCYNPGLIYVFMGKKAQEWSESVSDNNYKLFCSHPASAAHNALEKWDSGDIFNKTSDLCYKQFKYKIIW
jgi:uracil-DNA glycosylase